MATLFSCCGPKNKDRSHPVNDRLEFLVFLSPDDMKVRCLSLKSRRTLIEATTKYLQGRLHMAFNDNDMCMCCEETFRINGIVDTTAMYVLVPKEQVYVKLHQWEHEYLKSQVQELIYIFRRLGAESLRITVTQSHENKYNAGASLNARLQDLGIGTGIGAGIGMDVGSETSNMDNISTSMVFDPEKDFCDAEKKSKPSTISDLMEDPNIHYLANRPAWQGFINNRLQGHATTIHFCFTHHNVIYISKKLQAKLNQTGLMLHVNNTDLLWVKMMFEAEWNGEYTGSRRSIEKKINKI